MKLLKSLKSPVVSVVGWTTLTVPAQLAVLQDDAELFKAVNGALRAPAAVAERYKPDENWLTHYDATLQDWVCSAAGCHHAVSQHAQREFVDLRRASGTRTSSPIRKFVVAAYGETCPITGEPKVNCQATHLYKYADGVPGFLEVFSHLKADDIDSTKNVILARTDLNNIIERFELAFEPTRKVGEYKIFVPLHTSPTLNALRGKTVRLVADPKVLAWHLKIAKSKVAPKKGTDESVGGDGDADDSAGSDDGGEANKKKESKGKKGHTRRGAGQHKSGGVGGTRKGKGAHGAVDEKCCVVDPDQDLSGFEQIASRTVPIQRNRRLTPFNLALSQVIVN